jgi:hypothetical protein
MHLLVFGKPVGDSWEAANRFYRPFNFQTIAEMRKLWILPN